MQHTLAKIALIIPDYEQAITYYTDVLRFELVENSLMAVKNGVEKRWVVIAPAGTKNEAGCHIVLAKAANPSQENVIGNQTGGRVFLFLHTDDFYRDYNYMQSKGVEFTEEPREEEYGTVVVFKDIYGNKWDFIQPALKHALKPISKPFK